MKNMHLAKGHALKKYDTVQGLERMEQLLQSPHILRAYKATNEPFQIRWTFLFIKFEIV